MLDFVALLLELISALIYLLGKLMQRLLLR